MIGSHEQRPPSRTRRRTAHRFHAENTNTTLRKNITNRHLQRHLTASGPCELSSPYAYAVATLTQAKHQTTIARNTTCSNATFSFPQHHRHVRAARYRPSRSLDVPLRGTSITTPTITNNSTMCPPTLATLYHRLPLTLSHRRQPYDPATTSTLEFNVQNLQGPAK